MSKICKGINKAVGYGCGEVVSHRTYGLCHKCFKSWLFATAAGELEIAKRTIKAKKDRISQEKKRIRKNKEELLTVQDWIKIAQQAFNAYIRERDKNMNCISCDKPLKGKYDAGHYYSAGGHYSLRFDEDNVHGQCVACNQHKHGNLQRYREGILKRLDARILDRLDKDSQETRKFTREELKDITEHYKNKLKELRDEKAN